jgi:2-phospho-L-lactate/phosphoenolpyruvate guanylyltransferase
VTTWAIVPVKGFARGKSRLAPVLPAGAREVFARGLLEHVLGVLGACRLGGVLVATDSEEVAELARARGASARLDGASAGTLAEVLDAALADVEGRGAHAALVLMADLPQLAPSDVRDILRALDDHDVVLVADARGRHTNALALSPPTRIRTCFGRSESFREHCARAAGLRVAIVESAGVALDVDEPVDHALLHER